MRSPRATLGHMRRVSSALVSRVLQSLRTRLRMRSSVVETLLQSSMFSCVSADMYILYAYFSSTLDVILGLRP